MSTAITKLADWLEDLTVFDFPETHRCLIRTTTGLALSGHPLK